MTVSLGNPTTGVAAIQVDGVNKLVINSDNSVVLSGPLTTTNLSYTGTLTGGTGVINIGSGQIYKGVDGSVGIGTAVPIRPFMVTNGGVAGVALFESTAGSTVAIGLRNTGSSAAFPQVLGINDDFAVQTNGSERLRIDSAGNLGLGVVPSAWGSSGALELPSNIGISAQGVMRLFSNVYDNAGLRYVAPAAASYYIQSDGSHLWATAPSGTVGNPITFTQAMTLTNAGNLLVGTTTERGTRLNVSGDTDVLATALVEGVLGAQPSLRLSGGSVFEVKNLAGGGLTLTQIDVGERARITASGNLLVGATVDNGGKVRIRGGTTPLTFDATGTGGALVGIEWRASDNNLRAFIKDSTETPSGGEFRIATSAGESYLAFASGNNTERARITANGNLLVGTTTEPPFTGGTPKAFISSNGTAGNIFALSDGIQQSLLFRSNALAGASGLVSINATNAPNLAFEIGDVERARITSGGYFKASNTGVYPLFGGAPIHQFASDQDTVTFASINTNAGASVVNYRSDLLSASPTGLHFQGVNNNAATVYRVLASGSVENATNSYGAISDIKLKENVTDASPKLESLNQLRVVNYNLIGDDLKQIGLIAQEVEQVFPGLVAETPDIDPDTKEPTGEVTKSVKYSVLVPMLLKAVQELTQQNQDLSARLAALENK